jgi:hypothetical protein
MNLAYVADKPVPADENAPEDTSVLGQHVFNETAVRGRTTDK